MAVTLTKGRTFTNGEKVTPAKLNELVDNATVNGLGTMAEQAASAVVITGGSAVLSTFEVDLLKLTINGGYATSGAIALALNTGTAAYIELTGNATFTCAGQGTSNVAQILLKNTTAGSITLGWPAWSTLEGVTLPTSLAAGGFLSVRLFCLGANLSDVLATYN